ncbi:MAG: hypothetical protein ACOYYS_20010 [Chloroflexota bacterium]
MKAKEVPLLVFVILPLAMAAGSFTAIWPDLSIAAKLAFFSSGVWFGVAFTRWLWVRKENAA